MPAKLRLMPISCGLKNGLTGSQGLFMCEPRQSPSARYLGTDPRSGNSDSTRTSSHILVQNNHCQPGWWQLRLNTSCYTDLHVKKVSGCQSIHYCCPSPAQQLKGSAVARNQGGVRSPNKHVTDKIRLPQCFNGQG
jgi:hypothetical protein